MSHIIDTLAFGLTSERYCRWENEFYYRTYRCFSCLQFKSKVNPLDLSLLRIRKDPNFHRTGEYLRLPSGGGAKLL